MQDIIKDAVWTFAKQRGDKIADIGHVLYVVVTRFADDMSDTNVDVKKIEAYLGSAGDSIKPPESFSDAATAALAMCTTKQVAIAWAIETYRAIVEPHTGSVAGATNTASNSQPGALDTKKTSIADISEPQTHRRRNFPRARYTGRFGATQKCAARCGSPTESCAHHARAWPRHGIQQASLVYWGTRHGQNHGSTVHW